MILILSTYFIDIQLSGCFFLNKHGQSCLFGVKWCLVFSLYEEIAISLKEESMEKTSKGGEKIVALLSENSKLIAASLAAEIG